MDTSHDVTAIWKVGFGGGLLFQSAASDWLYSDKFAYGLVRGFGFFIGLA